MALWGSDMWTEHKQMGRPSGFCRALKAIGRLRTSGTLITPTHPDIHQAVSPYKLTRSDIFARIDDKKGVLRLIDGDTHQERLAVIDWALQLDFFLLDIQSVVHA